MVRKLTRRAKKINSVNHLLTIKAKKPRRINSKIKGKGGELEFAHLLREFGFDSRRGQQFSGANGDADVVGVDGVHFEVKRVEKLNLAAAFGQAARDARDGDVPVVAHRCSRQPWLVTMKAEDWLAMVKALDGLL